MYAFDELNKKIDYLQRLPPLNIYPVPQPDEIDKIFDDLRSAVEAYLVRDLNFELQVNKTLDKVIADSFFHGLEYQNMELLKKWMTYSTASPPEGYDDVTTLFKGAEIFKEIMEVRDMDFQTAFFTQHAYDSLTGYSTEECHNRYVDDWIARLTAAMNNELEGLKAIMQYCANRSYSVEWAVLFEELGMNVKRHPVRYYAKQIYLTRGWGWLIGMFNLNIYLPSYFD